jgi:hypothetical protein
VHIIFPWVSWLLVQGRIEWTWSVAACLIVSKVLYLGTWRYRTSGISQTAGTRGAEIGHCDWGLIATYTAVDVFGVKSLSIYPVLLDWFASIVRFALLSSAQLGSIPVCCAK